jgi:hypothetical protein
LKNYNYRSLAAYSPTVKIHEQIYSSSRQAETVLKKNRALNFEITKELNKHRSQWYLETIKEAKMPAIRITRREKHEDDITFSDDSPVARKGIKSTNDIKNMKIRTEAAKYIKNTDSEVFFWRKLSSTRFVPEVREQAVMIKVDNRIYIFGGLSHDWLGDFLTWDVNTWKWEKLDTI